MSPDVYDTLYEIRERSTAYTERDKLEIEGLCEDLDAITRLADGMMEQLHERRT